MVSAFWIFAITTIPGSPLTVVELFTSQGCSSCPPADKLLQELDQRNDVLGLSFHVDYWNRLGWKDPYSQRAWSERQYAYARKFGDLRVYTPQLVIRGRTHVVGSQRQAVLEALRLHRPGVRGMEVQVKATRRSTSVEVTLNRTPRSGNLAVALFQPQASQDVTRGENRGRALHHVNVVRAWESRPLPLTDSNWQIVASSEARRGAVIWWETEAIHGAQVFEVEGSPRPRRKGPRPSGRGAYR